MSRPAAIAVVLACAGCSVSRTGDPVDARAYDLCAADAVEAAGAIPSTPALQVEPFGASEVLDREGIVWRDGLEVGSYADHRWARPPQQAVREAVALALRTRLSGLTVATEPSLASPAYVLRALLARCEEVDRGAQWVGVAELRVVVATRDGVELLRKTYAGEESARARNPAGVVEALCRVVDRLAAELASDVESALSETGSPSRDRPPLPPRSGRGARSSP